MSGVRWCVVVQAPSARLRIVGLSIVTARRAVHIAKALGFSAESWVE